MAGKTSKKKTGQPPKTKDVFKLFRWYKRKWDRQAKADEREREKQESQAKAMKLHRQGVASVKNNVKELRALDRRSAEAARKRAAFFKGEQKKIRKINRMLKRMLARSE